MTEGYTISADFEHLAVALQSFWQPFEDILKEMDSFEAQPLSNFEGRIRKLAENVKRLNPEMSEDEAYEYAKKDTAFKVTPDMQFWVKFSDRLTTMYVTVTLLSHALCEAEINAVLATGLHEYGSVELFEEIQKKDIKEKWINGPRVFCPTYEFNKGTAIFETLNHLNKQRNAWVHHKVDLHVGEKKVIEGSNYQRHDYEDMARWLKRYFSLPFDLAGHTLKHNQSVLASLQFTRKPIPIADAHK